MNKVKVLITEQRFNDSGIISQGAELRLFDSIIQAKQYLHDIGYITNSPLSKIVNEDIYNLQVYTSQYDCLYTAIIKRKV